MTDSIKRRKLLKTVVLQPKRDVFQNENIADVVESEEEKKDDNIIGISKLNLMMLACEEKAPYGPPLNTAQMFLNFLSKAQQTILKEDWNIVSEHSSFQDDDGVVIYENNDETLEESALKVSVSITIYNCITFDYPTTLNEWNSYDGIILPGSFSAAYEAETPWIEHLKQVIRDEIHANSRPTLGVCFGHQIYAHALGECNDSNTNDENKKGTSTFWGGKATPCPSGTQAGRRSFTTTSEGSDLLFRHFSYPLTTKNDEVHLLYTHGDMVAQLPSCAVSLGGNSTVPIQSAAYFSSSNEAQQFKSLLQSPSNAEHPRSLQNPHVFTFQAHPEYVTTADFLNSSCGSCTTAIQANSIATTLSTATKNNKCNEVGRYFSSISCDNASIHSKYNDSYNELLVLMAELGMIPKESVNIEQDDTKCNQSLIQNDSIYVMMNVARILNWM